MKKRNLIILISTITFLLLIGFSVFAAFIFNTTITSKNVSGDITIEKEGYVSYSLNSDISSTGLTTAQYQAILKERAGGWVVDSQVETDLSTTYTNYYIRQVTEASSYSSGNTYYILDDTNNYVYRNVSSFDSNETYYTMTFTKASSYSSSTDYYRVGHQYDSSVTNETDLSTYYTLTGVDLEGFGIYTPAVSYLAGTKYFKLVYVPSDIEATGVITDGSSNNGITCVNTYGTQRDGSLAETENYIYLNQVGFEFSISTKIDCYIRIKFRDAWVSSKLYRGSSTPNVRYTPKRTILGRSPFYVQDSHWYFDTTDNVAYLKTSMQAGGTYNYSFNINPTYFYSSEASSYTERMIVQVSYSLELIQANRITTVWGIDPTEDFS